MSTKDQQKHIKCCRKLIHWFLRWSRKMNEKSKSNYRIKLIEKVSRIEVVQKPVPFETLQTQRRSHYKLIERKLCHWRFSTWYWRFCKKNSKESKVCIFFFNFLRLSLILLNNFHVKWNNLAELHFHFDVKFCRHRFYGIFINFIDHQSNVFTACNHIKWTTNKVCDTNWHNQYVCIAALCLNQQINCILIEIFSFFNVWNY